MENRPRLDDPKEMAIIRQIYFEPIAPKTEEGERTLKRYKKEINQAR